MRRLREKVTKVAITLLLTAGPAGAQAPTPLWTAGPAVTSGAADAGSGGVVVLGEGRRVYRLGAGGDVQWTAPLGDSGRAFPVVRPDGSVLAVQWHPEETLADLRLFIHLVDAAAVRAAARSTRTTGRTTTPTTAKAH